MTKLSEFYGAKVKFSRYTSPTTWTNPGNVDVIHVTASAGGGGANPLVGGGGGAACNRAVLHVNGSPVPITVGAGGAANARGSDTIVGPTANRIRLKGGDFSTATAPVQRTALGGGHIGNDKGPDGPTSANYSVSAAAIGGAYAAGGMGIGNSVVYMPTIVSASTALSGAAPFGYTVNGNTAPGGSLGGGDGIFGGAGQANSGAGGNRPTNVGQAGAVIIEWEE